MGTEVRFSMYFRRNNGMNNPNDKSSNKLPSGFSRTPTPNMDILLLGHKKEQMKQTILNQQSMIQHQLQELHRIYKMQRKLMLEIKSKESSGSSFLAEQATRSGSNVFLSLSSCSSRMEAWRIFGVEISASLENCLLSNLGTKEGGGSLGNKFQQFVHVSSSTTRGPYEKLKVEEASGARNLLFDLNVSPEEELEMDIDSEVPIFETDPPLRSGSEEDESAAETLVSISLSITDPKDSLRRLAEVISSSGLEISEIEDLQRIEGLVSADVAVQRNAAAAGKVRAKRHCGDGIDGVARWGRRARRTRCSTSEVF